MATYIVRTIDTLRLVGIFVAKTPNALYCLVDNELEPSTCEYLKLQEGEGLHIDAQFTGDMRDDGTGEGEEVLYVDIETVDDPEEPRFTDRLAERLDKGRSWTPFTTEQFAQVFGIPLAKLADAGRVADSVQ